LRRISRIPPWVEESTRGWVTVVYRDNSAPRGAEYNQR
jgi:hypothetical protein